MKRKILIVLAGIAVLVTTLVIALPAHASPGVLDHARITPTSATVPAGGPVQFLAQGYDDSDNATSGITLSWTVSGGGTIGSTGLFVAGTVPGKYTVQVTVVQGAIIKTATASVKVTADQSSQPSTNLATRKLGGMLGCYLNSVGFGNFLGGQWQVKNGNEIDTVQVIAGVVQSVSGGSLTVQVNGQSVSTYPITSNTTILPKGTQLAANDNVAIVLVNGQVDTIVKVTGANSGNFGSGGKNRNNNWFGRHGFPGWSHHTDNNQDND